MNYYLYLYIPTKNETVIYESIFFTTKLSIDRLTKKLDKFINLCLSTKQKNDKLGRLKKNIFFENILFCDLESPYASRSVSLKAIFSEENNSFGEFKQVRIPYFLLENAIIEIIPTSD